MAKPKNRYYAIKKGKETGIFEKPWSEVAPLVQGFQGSVYKGFVTLEDAENWLYETSREVLHIEQDENTLVAYVDGSSSASIEEYGCGVVLVFPDGEIEEIYFSGNNEDARSMKNVAGELSASMRAMQEAKKRGFDSLLVCHDYQGVSKWIQGDWDTNKPMTKKYVEWYKKNIEEHVNVGFKWIKGHSNNELNDLADALAKKSIGIGV